MDKMIDGLFENGSLTNLVGDESRDDAEHGGDDEHGQEDADGQPLASVALFVVNDVGGAAFSGAAATADAESGEGHDHGHEDAADGHRRDADVLEQDFRPVSFQKLRDLFLRRRDQHGLVEAGRKDVLALNEIKEGVSDGVDVLHASGIESESNSNVLKLQKSRNWEIVPP